MDTVPLRDHWLLEVGKHPRRDEVAPVPATVPGNVHQDLLANGLIDDPLLGLHEIDALWVGRRSWRYRRPLALTTDAERVDLVFDGLDTLATITVGDTVVGRTRNMHRRYRFDVTDLIGPDDRELTVDFASAQEFSDAAARELAPALPNATGTTFQYVRKMACSYGWDWGPVLATAGIWREPRLEAWSTARIAGFRPQTTLTGGVGVVELAVELERTSSGAGRPLDAEITVTSDGRRTTRTLRIDVDELRETIHIDEPAVWWPHGYGEPRLSELTFRLWDGDRLLDERHHRIGFRSVRIDETEDDHGRAFTLVVNDVPLFARGVNWIPDDLLLARVTPEQLDERLGQARAANVDLVRVWGGGVFEDRHFYERCDELGLLVWQDFLFACAAYPEEDPLAGEVEAEVRDNLDRLSPHPSIVVWNGNNENFLGHENWNWKPLIGDRTWGRGYYLDLLPRLVAELDPFRPYTAGSPWSGSEERHPNDPRYGSVHAWTKDDYLAYRNTAPRYVSEFGNQGPATWTTLVDAIGGVPASPEAPEFTHRQRMVNGNALIGESIERHFGGAADLASWHFLASLNQCRANQTAIDHWRSRWPDTAGAVLWQLNDCWPAVSWSVIDSAGRPKPMYTALQQSFAPRTISVQPRDGRPVLVVANQTLEPWSDEFVVRRMSLSGTALDRHTLPVTVEANSVAIVDLPARLTSWTHPKREFAVVEAASSGQRAWWYGVEDRDFELVPGTLDVAVTRFDDHDEYRLTATSLVKDVLIQPDRAGAVSCDAEGFFTMLPGEVKVVRLFASGSAALRLPDADGDPWVVANLNDVLARSRSGPGAQVAGVAAVRPDEIATSGPAAS